MNLLKRILTAVLIIILCISDSSTVTAASWGAVNSSATYDVDMKIALDGKAVNFKGYEMANDWRNYYYSIKDLVRLLKGSKKEFSFKYDDKKDTLTVYPGKNIMPITLRQRLSLTNMRPSGQYNRIMKCTSK